MKEKTPVAPTEIFYWLLLAFLALTWGSSFILMKKGLVAFSFDQVAGIRIMIAALFFMPILVAQRDKIPHDKWKYSAIVGICGNAIPAFLFAMAQTHLASGLAGILNSLTPLWVLLLGGLFFGVVLNIEKVLGILVGLAGAALLVLYQSSPSAGDEIVYDNSYGWYIVLATLLYGISANTIKKNLQDISPTLGSAMAFGIVGLPTITYLLLGTDFTHRVVTHPQAMYSLGFIAILAIVNTVVGNVGYYILIQRTNAVFASVVTYLMPPVSLLLGSLDGEPIVGLQIVGMLLILSGVYLVSKSG